MRISDWISDVCSSDLVDFGALDLRWIGAIVSRDGAVEETGLGAGVLGDPARSVSWLVDRLARYGGRIEAGQTVLSGSFIRPIECSPGSHIRADFGTFGGIECRFALRSEEHTSELQSLMRISYAVFCLKKKNNRLRQ